MKELILQRGAAGVKIAFGTDTGVSKHGDNAQEFALMVQAGMTPAQAIRAATVSAADLIAVTGSPLEDVRRLEHVDFAMHRGVVDKLGGKPAAVPALAP